VRLVARAPGKVNLCLFVGSVRPDGRHELVTLFESVSLADEVSMSVEGSGDCVACPGVEGANIAAAALAGLRQRGWPAPAVAVKIRKRIPVAGGMGGGSADAAAILRLAGAVARVDSGVLSRLAAELGADVPSQLTPGLVLGTGAGDVVEAAEPVAPHALVVVPQPFELSTALVYREADCLGLPRAGADLSARLAELRAALGAAPARLPAELAASGARAALEAAPARLPAELLVNDLEPAALSLRPEIAPALEAVRAAGASPAMVSGSGPTVVGVYWGDSAQERAAATAEALAGRYPGACSVVPVAAGFGDPMGA
jgi:4-diphosphocytidyl-2-C-methyl-D-erythritol kinase